MSDDLLDRPDAAMQLEAMRQQRDELLAALNDAVTIIRTWHGMGMGDREAEAWGYYQHSPEMRQLNALIARIEQAR
jgi:hypothetical protein